MVCDVCAQNHFGDDLSHIPILSFGEKLENIVLWIKKQFESNSTVMIFKDRNVIVPQSFLMLDSDQEIVVHPRMSHIMKHTGQKPRHHLQIRQMAHQLTILYEVMEIPSCVDDSQRIMELSRLIAFLFDVVKKVLEVVV